MKKATKVWRGSHLMCILAMVGATLLSQDLVVQKNIWETPQLIWWWVGGWRCAFSIIGTVSPAVGSRPAWTLLLLVIAIIDSSSTTYMHVGFKEDAKPHSFFHSDINKGITEPQYIKWRPLLYSLFLFSF